MRRFFRQSFHLHPGAAWVSGLLTALVAWAVGAQLPSRWVVEADVFLAEPYTFQRLASPFSSLPDADASLRGLDEALLSTERLVALAKGTGLLDRYQADLPWPQRAWRALQAKVGAAPTEKEQLDALVEVLRKKVSVELRGRHAVLSAEWADPETALQMVRAQLEVLVHGRGAAELTALEQAMAAVDERLALVQTENTTRKAHLEQELDRADREDRVADVSADLQVLIESTQREQELMVRDAESHLGRDVARRAIELRTVVLTPPRLPSRPASAPPWRMLLVAAFAALLSALTGPLVVALGSGRLVTPAQVEALVGLPVLGRLRLDDNARYVWRQRDLIAVVTLAVASGVAAGLSRGSPLVAALPVVVALLAWAVWTLPLKWPVLALLLAAVTLDDPTDRPYAAMWQSPLYPLGKLLFTNVALFTGFEVCVYALLGLMLLRRLRRSGVDHHGPPAPWALRAAVLLSAATVLWLVAMGVARGGSFRFALWQFRYLLFLPAFAALALRAFEFPRDLGKLLGVILTGSLVKAALGAWFMYQVAGPAGLDPPHTTGHNDTVLLVTAACVPLALWWERPRRQYVLLALLWLPLTFLAIKLNDRRIAYVELVMCAGAVYLVSPMHRVKRLVTRAALMVAPLVLLYGAAGWTTKGGRLFAPVQKVRSIVAPPEGTEEETSNADRDTENYNLRRSWEGNPLLGQGFGHAFIEFRPFNDFRASNFGQIGHNSMLWLLWIGGLSGYLGVLLYVGVTVFFLGRTLPRAPSHVERSALLIALSILVAYVNQAFGDMGTQSIEIDMIVGVAIAIVGALATRHGAAQVERAAPTPATA